MGTRTPAEYDRQRPKPRVNITMSHGVRASAEELAEQMQISLSALIEMALVSYVQKMKKKE